MAVSQFSFSAPFKNIALSMGKRVVSLGSWKELDTEDPPENLVFASTPKEAVELAFEP